MEAPAPASLEGATPGLSFNIGGEGFGFDGRFTEGKFIGKIRGADGKEFAGFAEILSDGRYRVEDWESGRMFEPPSEQAAPPAEAAPVGFADAAAVAAIETAEPARVAEPAAPVVEVAEAVAELQPAAPEPAALPTAQEPATQPEAMRAAPSADRALIRDAKKLMDEATDSSRLQKFTGQEQLMRKQTMQEQLKGLKERQQGVLDRLNRAKKPDTIKKLTAEDDQLRRETAGLEKQIAAFSAPEEFEVAFAERRQATAESLSGELDQWRQVMSDPKDFEEYRRLKQEIAAKRSTVDELYPQFGPQSNYSAGGSRGNQAREDALAQLESEHADQLAALEAKLPRRLLELAGLQRERTTIGGQPGVDADLWQTYNSVCQQLYAELAGQPAPVLEPTSALPPEPVATGEVPEQPQPLVPVEEVPTGEEVVPTQGETVAPGQPTEVELPEKVAETAPAPMPEQQPEPTPAALVETPAPMPEQAAEPPAEPAVEPPTEEQLAKEVIITENPDGSINYRFGGGGMAGGSNIDYTILNIESYLADPRAMAATMPGATPERLQYALRKLQEMKAAKEAAPAQAPLPAAQEPSPATVPPAGVETAVEELPADIPDWLKTPSWLGPTSTPTAEAPAPGMGAPVPDSELPDWMSGISPAEAEAPVPAPEAPSDQRREYETRKTAFEDSVDGIQAAFKDRSGTKEERIGRVVDAIAKAISAGADLAHGKPDGTSAVAATLSELKDPRVLPLTEAAAKKLLVEGGAFDAAGRPKSKEELERMGAGGIIEFLISLGAVFTDASINAVISEVQTATGSAQR